jgi:uncharacterized membrane protein YcjF (UPF0283 family)
MPTDDQRRQPGHLHGELERARHHSDSDGGGDISSIAIIAAAVGVPVVVLLIAVVAIVVAVMVWRTKGGLRQPGLVARRNSVQARKTTLASRTVKELHSNQLFNPETSRARSALQEQQADVVDRRALPPLIGRRHIIIVRTKR